VTEVSTNVVSTVKNFFYIDCVKSVDIDDIVIKLATEVKLLFRIRLFQTNQIHQ